MRTGHPPGLLQDDCRALHLWFASRVDARWVVRRWFGDATGRWAALQNKVASPP
jgi:hypothetical protein